MKLLSLNVALFEQNNAQLADFIQAQQPDILCLQEVTKKIDEQAKSEFISQPAIDQASPALAYNFFAPIWVMENFNKDNFHGDEHFQFELGGWAELGNYVRSRFPISQGKNVFVQNEFSYVTDWSCWPEDDVRAVQVTDIDLPETKLRILNYHGIWSRDKLGTDLTLQACHKIKQLALEVDYPAIICGDFNLFPDTDSMQVFADQFESLVDTYKIKTTRPQSNELSAHNRNIVDYVLVSKGVKVSDFAVPDVAVSDHLPLVVEFSL